MSFATFLQGSSPFGPIFAKELRVTARRKRTYWLRAVYLGLLLLVMLWAWAITTRSGYRGGVAMQNQQQSMLGQIFFAIFAMFSVYAMGLLGPILTSTAIGSERLQKTLPVLLMTPITAWQIVAGKLFSRLLVSITLIGLGLPVLALVRLLGGVELEQMLGAVALALATALTSASIGLFYSTILTRSFAVILLSYFTMGLLYLFEPVVLAYVFSVNHPGNPTVVMTTLFSTNPYAMIIAVGIPEAYGRLPSLPWGLCLGSQALLSMLLVLLSAALLRRQARRAGEMASPAPAVGSLAVAPPPLPMIAPAPVGVVGADDAEATRQTIASPVLAADSVPPMPKRPMPLTSNPRSGRTVADNPILWREVRRPLMARRWQRIGAMAIVVVVMGFIFYMQADNHEFISRDWQMGYAVAYNFVFSVLALVIPATAIAQEKEGDTWTLLLATPISGRAIVWGKALGAARRLLAPFFLICLHFAFFATFTQIEWLPVFCVIYVIAACNCVWIASGVYFSLRFSKVTVAVVMNFLLALTIYAIVPAILGLISVLTDRDIYVKQVVLYLPYYYLTEAIDRLRGSFSLGLRSTFYWPPLSQNISNATFLFILLAVGAIHILLAFLILAHTAHHFDKLVGRARQLAALPPSRSSGRAVKMLPGA